MLFFLLNFVSFFVHKINADNFYIDYFDPQSNYCENLGQCIKEMQNSSNFYIISNNSLSLIDEDVYIIENTTIQSLGLNNSLIINDCMIKINGVLFQIIGFSIKIKNFFYNIPSISLESNAYFNLEVNIFNITALFNIN